MDDRRQERNEQSPVRRGKAAVAHQAPHLDGCVLSAQAENAWAGLQRQVRGAAWRRIDARHGEIEDFRHQHEISRFKDKRRTVPNGQQASALDHGAVERTCHVCALDAPATAAGDKLGDRGLRLEQRDNTGEGVNCRNSHDSDFL